MAHPTTVEQVEADCRAFAEMYPTANVRYGVQLAEAGRVSWVDLYRVFSKSLTAGLDAVR